MKKPCIALCIIAAVTVCNASATTVYKIVDEQGNVTFTDKPPAGEREKAKAEKVVVKPANIQQPVSLAKSRSAPNDENDPAGEFQGYGSARIASPADQATIPPGQTSVTVQVALQPALQQNHRVQFLVNGKNAGEPVSGTSTTLSSLARGEYTLSAKIIDGSGKPLATTKSITIYVKRASVINRPQPAPAP
ncbi:MAG: DUF4124 domain-containing protein [bacterium]